MPGFFDLSDPQSSMPLLGLLQGLGQAAAPSRTPVPLGTVFGDAAQGYMGGLQQAQQQQAMQSEIASRQADLALKNMTLDRTKAFNNMLLGGGNQTPANAAAVASTQAPAPVTTAGQGAGPSTPAMNATAWQAPANAQMDPTSFFSKLLGVPVTVTSAVRDDATNKRVHGSPTSEHLARNGQAYDIVAQGMPMDQVAAKLAAAGLPYDQLIQEGNHVHIGFGPSMRGEQLRGSGPYSRTSFGSPPPTTTPAAPTTAMPTPPQTGSGIGSMQDFINTLPPAFRQMLATMDPDQAQATLVKLMNKPRELTGDDLKEFLRTHPGANPNSSWAIDPLTGLPTETVKSDTRSPAAQQQAIDTSTAEAVARYSAPLDALKEADPGYIDRMARAIATYSAKPPSNLAGRTNPVGNAIMDRVLEINPEWKQGYFDLSNKTLAQFDSGAANAPGSKVRALNTSIQHLDLLGKVADALNANNPKAIQALQNAWSTQFGTSPLPNDLRIVSALVSREIDKAISNGYSGVSERGDVHDTLNADLSKGLIKDAIGTFKGLLGGQMNSLKTQFVAGMHGMKAADAEALFQRYVAPETQAALGNNPMPPSMQGGGNKPNFTPAQLKMLPHPKTPAEASQLHNRWFVDPTGTARWAP